MEYNPVSPLIADLSLSFDTSEMVVTTTYPDSEQELDKEGEAKHDENGRPLFKTFWRPYTGIWACELIYPNEPLPERLMPAKPFSLEGLVGNELRFSPQGIEAFAAGATPPADLAERLLASIDRRVAFPRPSLLYLVAAYVVMTYLFPLAARCPFLALHSEVPGAGKTTAMEVIERVAFNAHRMGVSSLAVTVRLAANARCTLLLDEQEKLGSQEQAGDLVEVLNARADAGSTYRNLGPDGRPRSFELFGPTIISNLAGLPPTLRSRSITIQMQPLEDTGNRHAGRIAPENWQALRDGLLLWAGANWRAVKESHDSDPAMNVGGNRHADLWRLLLAVGWNFGGMPMFEALYEEASAAAAGASPDALADAMALGVAATIASQANKAERSGNSLGSFDVSLKYLHGKAIEGLEEDQQSQLRSTRVAAFARSLKLETPRSGRYGGATAVVFGRPAETLALLRARFPHLGELLS